MSAVLKIIAGALGLGFALAGVAWWIAPEFAAKLLGMDLLAGVGLSSQIADLGAFFLTLGSTILIGLYSANRIWFYPPIMLLSLAIVGCLIAWRFHGADLAIDMIAVEAFAITILLFNVRELSKRKA